MKESMREWVRGNRNNWYTKSGILGLEMCIDNN